MGEALENPVFYSKPNFFQTIYPKKQLVKINRLPTEKNGHFLGLTANNIVVIHSVGAAILSFFTALDEIIEQFVSFERFSQ